MKLDTDIGGTPAQNVGSNGPLFVDGRNVHIDAGKGGTALIDVLPNDSATINVSSNPTLLIGLETQASATVNLAANSQWIGSFVTFPPSGTQDGQNATLIVNGGPKATFIHDTFGAGSGSAVGGTNSVAVLNVPVVGTAGTGDIAAYDGGKIEFGQSVNVRQIDISANAITDQPLRPGGIVQIDQPANFHASVQFDTGEIDLIGLANADSYSLTSDLLSIYSGGKVIYTLPLTRVGTNDPALEVEQTTKGVTIFSVTQSSPPPGTVLPPIHVGS